MIKLQILHNNRCGKSRSALQKVEASSIPFEIVNYLDGVLSEKDVASILKKLNKKPLEVIRTNESLFKENYKGKNLSDKEWISVLQQNPILIERPILIYENEAIIGRPEETVDEFLKNIK